MRSPRSHRTPPAPPPSRPLGRIPWPFALRFRVTWPFTFPPLRSHASLFRLLALSVLFILVPGCNAVRYGVPGALSGSDPEAFVLSLGPLVLPAGVDHMEAPQPTPLHAVFPRDGWVHGFEVEVVDGAGNRVPHEVLHHVKLLLPERRELFKPIALRLIGAGAETRATEVPSSLGLPVERGDSILVTAMVHNPTGTDFTDVEVRLVVRYSPEPAGRVTAAYPFFLHVTPPDQSSDYDLPPGRSERHWEARPAVGGRVIGFGGHLHRYGVELRLEDVSTGKVLWRTHPMTDAEGRILEIPQTRYIWSRGPRLDPERTYRVVAVYHNPTDEVLRGGGMGTIGGVLRPEGPWPERDPADPLFVFDMERELASGHGGAHGGHDGPHGGHH